MKKKRVVPMFLIPSIFLIYENDIFILIVLKKEFEIALILLIICNLQMEKIAQEQHKVVVWNIGYMRMEKQSHYNL